MDYAKILEGLKGLINDKTSPEDAQKIAELSKQVETAKSENDDLIIKHEDLRTKYVEALKQSVFSQNPQDSHKEEKPKTLEECINEVISKRTSA